MTRSRLVFALHFHQPYGNLDAVFEEACVRCYLPILRALDRHPGIRTAVHVSGCLLDWLDARERAGLQLPDTSVAREFPDRLRSLIERGQVELLGGGDQEPMLAVLPERDAHGQLVTMAERCERGFGARPTGMWLTERVWEPDLARVVAGAGYRYTLLDDNHLLAAGVREPLGAYYVTDKAGASLAVLPIARGLRARIPFARVEDVIEHLTREARVFIYGDDAEKFGLWPTTWAHVWGERWLERFFEALESRSDAIETVLPGRLVEETTSAGHVYVPTIAYAELGEWALPTEAAVAHRELVRRIESAGLSVEASPFLRGGIWQGFLAKYPESNLIYRKMLRVSDAVERARVEGHPRWAEARARLYQGQCNCAYWHGLFGGLYVPHLRAALLRALLDAEELVAPASSPRVDVLDHDGDRVDDLVFESPSLRAYVAPVRGGCIDELDLRGPRYCPSLVLGRRPEPYHDEVARARPLTDAELGTVSAHDLVRATARDLASKLVTDPYPRGVFVDHVLPGDATPEDFDRHGRTVAPLHAAHLRIAALDRGEARAELEGEIAGFRFRKRLDVQPRLRVTYALEAEPTERSELFASHVDLTLLAPDDSGGRRVEVFTETDDQAEGPSAPGARASHARVTRVRVTCTDLGVDLTLEPSPPCTLWRLPIETVSRSERGFEASYQGTCFVFVWPLILLRDMPFEASLTLDTGAPP
jgi:hypothetical protein